MKASRDDLEPRAPDRRGRGLLLALVMHLLLVGGLAIGVNWRSSEPDAVQAELWAAVPQAAAPAPEPPPPPPPRPPPEPKPEPPAPKPRAEPPPPPDRSAEIALEREARLREEAEKREKEAEARKLAEKRKQEEAEKRKREEAEKRKREEAERTRLAAEKKAREEAERRQAAEQEKRLQAQREERLRQLMSQAGTGTAEQGVAQGGAAGSPSPSYGGRLRARIRPNIVFAGSVANNPEAEVEVRAAPDGTILSSKLLKSSGNSEWDAAVMRAIEKTQTLPRDDNGRVPSPIVITFRPRDF